MRVAQKFARRKREQGVIITLVAIFMLGVIGAMAALSIDVVTMYTARSEAQLAADAAALAAARVIANSGATSDPSGGLLGTVTNIPDGPAYTVAIQVATQNWIAGVPIKTGQVSVNFFTTNYADPTVKVRIQKNDLPTFFARIWGRTQLAVAAAATAEAYNPTNTTASATNPNPPVAPVCVKPWLLPNLDPSSPTGTAPIFDPTSGAVVTNTLLGWNDATTPNPPYPMGINETACPNTNCTNATLPLSPTAWLYYPGDYTTTFKPPPTTSFPSCTSRPLTTDYQESIAGCVPAPISCNSLANVDLAPYPNPLPGTPNRTTDTDDAENCLTHCSNNQGDTLAANNTPPSSPFEFVGGADNPIPGASGNDVMVSDSLVTVPVTSVDTTPAGWANCTGSPCQLQIIGFVQLFLNPDGNRAPIPTTTTGRVNATVINLIGCGTSSTGTAIQGNGASPVAVRLIKSQ